MKNRVLAEPVVVLFAVAAFLAGFLIQCASIQQHLRFNELEKQVAAMPFTEGSSIDLLAARFNGLAKNEPEKAWVIFCWITRNIRFDVKGDPHRDAIKRTVDEILKQKKALSKGYALLYTALAERVGLQSFVINGFGRTGGEDTFDHSRFDHTWNAVKVDGSWKLVDCSWGAGYFDNDRQEFLPVFMPFYFFTPPEHFIYSHFPADPGWQLLEKPVSQDEFTGQLFTRPAYFFYKMEAVSHLKYTIESADMLALVFKIPSHVYLSADLIQDGKVLPARYGLIQTEGGKCTVHLCYPQSGTYLVRIFAKQKNDKGLMKWVLEYKIKVSRKTNSLAQFPYTYDTFHQKGGVIYDPLQGILKKGQKVYFRLLVPGARRLFVVVFESYSTELTKKGDLFTGDVLIRGGPVKVVGQFTGQQYPRPPILQYEVE